MKNLQNAGHYLNLLKNIHYENQNGGAYAYVQFLAYTREIHKIFSFSHHKEMEKIESARWLFNEYLCSKFTHSNKVIFEENCLMTIKIIEDLIKVNSNSVLKKMIYIEDKHMKAA